MSAEKWHVDSNGDVLDEGSLLIARPQHRKHARLIAAAPDLLAALQGLKKQIGKNRSAVDSIPDDIFNQVNAAIDKATQP